MSSHIARYTVAGIAVSAVVLMIGRWLAGPVDEVGVTAGVLMACMTQLFATWLLVDVLLPRQRFLAYGLGMLMRLGVVAGTALLLVPRTGVPAVPTLLTLVSVFFALAVLEPVFLPSSKETIAR